ncbi:MAG: prepilin peptidase [Oscillospiraceae bacterium]|nr:prepilin peptidase [Oscillospiraceae bacterium]
MDIALTVVLSIMMFAFGSVVGSFLNVVAYRVPKKESLIKGRSHCTTCGKKILNRDLIPVFSWIFLGGKCRFCKSRISSQYMVVELIMGLSYLAAYLVLGLTLELAYAVVLFPILMTLSLWDYERKEIPYACSISIAVLGLISIFTAEMPWYEHLIGAAIIAVPFAVLAFLGTMGGGDVQLMAAAGLLLGWNILPAAMIGIILGAIFGIVIKAITKHNLICFGPFLSIGIAAGYLFGTDIINAYVGLIR